MVFLAADGGGRRLVQPPTRAAPRAGPLGSSRCGESRARDVKRDRGGVRYVEAREPAGQCEACDYIAMDAGETAQALAFGADRQGEGGRQGCSRKVGFARAVEADHKHIEFVQFLERAGEID